MRRMLLGVSIVLIRNYSNRNPTPPAEPFSLFWGSLVPRNRKSS